jgi:hypothetical protein
LYLPSIDGVVNNPFRQGLGEYYDVSGVLWDVQAVIGVGNEYVCARMVDDDGEWVPYTVELLAVGAA